MTTLPGTPSFTIKGWHVLTGLILFFGIVIGADALFVSLAYRTFSGQVAANPYEAGLAYNRTLAEQARQEGMGWTATLSEPAEGGLVVAFSDRKGRGIDGLTVRALLERPATEQGRRRVSFKSLGGGRYASPVRLDGAWDVRIEAVAADGARFKAERRLIRP